MNSMNSKPPLLQWPGLKLSIKRIALLCGIFSLLSVLLFTGGRILTEALTPTLFYLTVPYAMAGIALSGALYFTVLHDYRLHSLLIISGITTLCGLIG